MRKSIFSLLALFSLFFLNTAAAQSPGEFTEKGGFSLTDNMDNEEHYFLFLLNDRPGDLPELRGEITKYIWKEHPQEKLKITQIKIDGELANIPILHIKAFSTKAQAMAFYQKLKANKPEFMEMGMTTDFFAISKTNFQKVIRAKSLKGYKPFFAINY